MRTSAFLLGLSSLAAAAAPVFAQQDAPASGWIFVGRVAEGGRFTAGPAVDAKGTSVSAGKVSRLALSRDASLATADDCRSVKLDDLRAPTDADLQKQYPMLRGGGALTVESTSECPSIGNAKLVYAKVSAPKDRVQFTTLADLNKR